MPAKTYPLQAPFGYGIMSYPGFVLMFCNQDSEHPMQIFKREFMPLEGILQDVGFYAVQEDYESFYPNLYSIAFYLFLNYL